LSLFELLFDYYQQKDKLGSGNWTQSKLFEVYSKLTSKSRNSNKSMSQLSFMSTSKLRENNGELEIVSIKFTEVKSGCETFLMV